MKKKILGIALVLLALFAIGVVYAQGGWGAKDVEEAIPENEYYVTAFYSGGGSRQYKVSSCGEAISLKDRLFHDNSSVISVSIRGKYRVHMWHDDCNMTYRR